ncbi:hypothetical protein ACCS96_50230, partial [Rhizobium ruizarguesonis]
MTSLAKIWRDGNDLVEREVKRLSLDLAQKAPPQIPPQIPPKTDRPPRPIAANDNQPQKEDPTHRCRLDAIQREHGGEIRLSGSTLTLFGANIDGTR